ncbi:MAG TPA: hydantoinase B/oxoprolinase family protein [Chloroflexota bacterium]
MSKPRPHPDAITAEIIRNAVVAITDEMKTNLMRTAYNQIIYEALDFTVGLFDAEGETISIGLGLPMFIRGLSDSIKAKLAFYGCSTDPLPPGGGGLGRGGANGKIEPGDILLTNDSYIMGSHLNHMIFSLPIFWEGEIVAFSSSMAHWQDVGGTLGAPTRDIYSEGIQLPIVKIFKRGEQDRELTDIIRTNVRFPDLAMGDFRAQIASIKTGERRFLDLLRRYGKDAVLDSIARIYDQSERLARASVASIPDGIYEAESFMDDDGLTFGQPIPIKVKVIVAGEEMTIDLSEVSRQVGGYYNSGVTAGRSAAEVAFKCVTSPLLLPINYGSFRPLNIELPAGRVISALKPAATRMWMTIPMTVVDTILKALAPAIPERVAAGHHADLVITNTYGVDPRTGRFAFGMAGPGGGGWGAKYNEDGENVTVCLNDGDTHNSPAEAGEVKSPVIVREFALRQDSGGAGKFRGGLGVRRAIEVIGSVTLNSQIERTQCAPWGLEGGQEALANRIHVERADGTRVEPANGKLYALQLNPGDVFVVESGGGGGFGDPFDRPIERVQEDVRLGYVSPQAARDDYGVVLDEKLNIDAAPTEQLRAVGVYSRRKSGEGEMHDRS